MTKFDNYRKKSFTNYWNNFSTTPKSAKSFSIVLKNIKIFIQKIFPYSIKIKIHKKNSSICEMFSSFQTDKEILFYRNYLLRETVLKFLKDYSLNYTKKDIENYIDEYCKVFFETPIKDLNSGFGFNEGLFLFCIIKVVKPTLVIESGIMKGFTTYLIDSASNHNCIINCYDISFDNIEYRSKKAKYFNNDINESPPKIKDHKVLAFWDDHTAQLDRLEFSIQNKIEYNIFDDDLGFLNFHSDGWPPIPSITMLFEIKRNLIRANKINWLSRGRKGKMFIDKFFNNKAIEKILVHKKFENLFNITGYQNHSECSFVTLKKDYK